MHCEDNIDSSVYCVTCDLVCKGTFAIRKGVFAGDCFVRILAVVDLQRAFLKKSGNRGRGELSSFLYSPLVGEPMRDKSFCTRQECWEKNGENN